MSRKRDRIDVRDVVFEWGPPAPCDLWEIRVGLAEKIVEDAEKQLMWARGRLAEILRQRDNEAGG